LGGTLGILGTLNSNLGGFPLLVMPLNIGPSTGAGIGGTATSGIPPFDATMYFTGWTTGAVTITPTAGGIPMTPSFRSGSDSRTLGGLGQINLVTPMMVRTTIAGTTAVFGTLTINFVPEPSTFTLFAAGIVGLGVARQRRTKK
jgi:hypothetical protein